MERDRFPLSASREPNPLRPYHVPPSAETRQPTFSTSLGKSDFANSHKSPAHDLLPHLGLNLKASAGEAWQNARSLLDTLTYRYISALLAQPFDVAKVVLQVTLPSSSSIAPLSTSRLASATNRPRHGSRKRSISSSRRGFSNELDYSSGYDSSEDADVPDYFKSSTPRRLSRRKQLGRAALASSPSPSGSPAKSKEPRNQMTDRLTLKRTDSITHAIASMYNISGVTGLWRATNCTFLYNAILRTTDVFIRSLLLAVFGLPDIVCPAHDALGPAIGVSGNLGLGGLDLNDSPNAIWSLLLVGLSSALSGLLLSPLDQVRTRLIVTPFYYPPRGLIQGLRRLPSLLVPSSLWLPTVLAHTIPHVFSAASPLVLRRYLRITPDNAPTVWSIAVFTTCLTDLFLRLPLETLVRRAQVKAIQVNEPDAPMIIRAAPSYDSISKTIYSILYLEGETEVVDSKGVTSIRQGQGLAGLVHGWRAGFWGLVGVWVAGAIGPGDSKNRGEF